jgi:hypothetical protein
VFRLRRQNGAPCRVVKLLLDENLSPRLVRLIDDLFAGSVHVRSVGFKQTLDREIWEFARFNGFAILTRMQTSRTSPFHSVTHPRLSFLKAATTEMQRPKPSFAARLSE